MVMAQEPTQSLAALHGLLAADVGIPREQQEVVLPLMVPLSMVMLDEFAQGSSQGALTKKNDLRQTLVLDRPDPALRIDIQVRAAGRQHEPECLCGALGQV